MPQEEPNIPENHSALRLRLRIHTGALIEKALALTPGAYIPSWYKGPTGNARGRGEHSTVVSKRPANTNSQVSGAPASAGAASPTMTGEVASSSTASPPLSQSAPSVICSNATGGSIGSERKAKAASKAFFRYHPFLRVREIYNKPKAHCFEFTKFFHAHVAAGSISGQTAELGTEPASTSSALSGSTASRGLRVRKYPAIALGVSSAKGTRPLSTYEKVTGVRRKATEAMATDACASLKVPVIVEKDSRKGLARRGQATGLHISFDKAGGKEEKLSHVSSNASLLSFLTLCFGGLSSSSSSSIPSDTSTNPLRLGLTRRGIAPISQPMDSPIASPGYMAMELSPKLGQVSRNRLHQF
jgi:hypothetical protein